MNEPSLPQSSPQNRLVPEDGSTEQTTSDRSGGAPCRPSEKSNSLSVEQTAGPSLAQSTGSSHDQSASRSPYQSTGPLVDQNASLPSEQSTSPQIAELIERIKKSVDNLARDHTSRGDLKIIARTLQELRYAFKVFRPYRWRRKVVMFGSARTPPHDPAYQQAVAFGRAMAAHEWFVITGAASGIMEAGHVGAGREYSMGLNILLPFEQASNPIIAGDRKLVYMKYFFNRKLMFVKECNAVCLLPGGFGTLDEGLEVLTLLQTGKRDMIPVVFLDAPGGDYWKAFLDFVKNYLLRRGMIDPEDMSLLKTTDSVEQAVAEILSFFRVYHSMRYVGQNLVLRLNNPLSSTMLERINEQFADMLVSGNFVLGNALPEEADEPELASLPRLIFHFHRRNFGRLRQLIDFINAKVEND